MFKGKTASLKMALLIAASFLFWFIAAVYFFSNIDLRSLINAVAEGVLLLLGVEIILHLPASRKILNKIEKASEGEEKTFPAFLLAVLAPITLYFLPMFAWLFLIPRVWSYYFGPFAASYNYVKMTTFFAFALTVGGYSFMRRIRRRR